MLCLVVFGCVGMWVVVCSVVLPVASVLASMRCLLCGGDGSKKKTKTTSVIFLKKKCPAREFIPITVLINSKSFKTASNYEFYRLY